MMHKHKLLEVNLRLFDGAAGAGDGGNAGAGAAQGAEGAAKAETNGRPGSSRRGKTGETILYGKQPDAAVTEQTSSDAGSKGGAAAKVGATTSSTMEERRRAFEERIEGEDKDLFEEKFQQAFNRRFKATKEMETSLSAQKPIMDILMQRYNIADGDMGKLQEAIEQDNRYYEEAAEEAGLSVEQYKAMQKLERENAELKQMRQRQQADQRAQAQLAKWVQEGEALKELYPGFDLRTECADRDFMGLLKSGLSVQKAYEVKHMEEIKANAAKSAAQAAGQQMAAKIQAKASRPKENGMSTQSAVIVKSDVHNLSKKDRANVARDVMSGKTVRF